MLVVQYCYLLITNDIVPIDKAAVILTVPGIEAMKKDPVLTKLN